MGFIDKLKKIFSRNKVEQIEESGLDKEGIVNLVTEELSDNVEEDLDAQQEEINKLYESDGLTDDVLDRQVALNGKRNELDIPDKEHLDKDGWSQ